jgi:hypothetical protein
MAGNSVPPSPPRRIVAVLAFTKRFFFVHQGIGIYVLYHTIDQLASPNFTRFELPSSATQDSDRVALAHPNTVIDL